MDSAETVDPLLQRAIGGDASALEAVLAAHYARLLAYVRKHMPEELSASVDPADVLQDTYFEACRLIGGFRPDGDDCLFRWLVTIARHRMLAHLRRHRTRRQTSSAPGGGGGDDDDVASLVEQLAVYRRTPSRSAAAHELIAAVERAIARLPDDYRQAVTLRHIDGLSVPEVAARMGRTRESVYVLVCRALRAIRQDLGSASVFL